MAIDSILPVGQDQELLDRLQLERYQAARAQAAQIRAQARTEQVRREQQIADAQKARDDDERLRLQREAEARYNARLTELRTSGERLPELQRQPAEPQPLDQVLQDRVRLEAQQSYRALSQPPPPANETDLVV